MRPERGRSSGRLLAARLVIVVVFATTTTGPVQASQPAAPPDGVADLAPLHTVEQYLSAFESNYVPPEHELAAWHVAEAAASRSANELGPRLWLTQGLEWATFSELSLDLNLGVELPLLSPTADAAHDLAQVDLASQRQSRLISRSEAKASLLVDLANLATLDWAQQLLGAALLRTAEVVVGQANDDGYVAAEDRELHKALERLRDTARWLDQQTQAVYRRLGRSLDRPATTLAIPRLTDIDDHLNAAAQSLSPATCAQKSPLIAAARWRHRQNVASDTLDAAPHYEIGVSARVGYSLAPTIGAQVGAAVGATVGAATPATSGAAFSAAIRLEGRYLLPESWPVAGSLGVGASPAGLDQRWELSWPPPARPARVVSDRQRQLAEELEDVAADLQALRSEWLAAREDQERLERELSWLLVDVSPGTDESTVRRWLEAALESPTMDAWPEAAPAAAGIAPQLDSVELRLQIAFERLAELTARARYLAACGSL